MQYLIGIDDTDNLDGPGTGHRVRQLAAELGTAGIAQPEGITRHQLLVSPEIPYTSHNSSACLTVQADESRVEPLWAACKEFLLRESAPGSDAGLCLAACESVGEAVQTFGARAKLEVLTQAEAILVAQTASLQLAGLTGTGGGVIGALAGVGLRAAGNDGRFLWLPGLRELTGRLTVAQLRAQAHIEEVCDTQGKALDLSEMVEVGAWLRPILQNGHSVLLVEEVENGWRVIAKERIKNLTE